MVKVKALTDYVKICKYIDNTGADPGFREGESPTKEHRYSQLQKY